MPKIPLALVIVGERMRQSPPLTPVAFDRLKTSISRYGLIQPLVLDSDNTLICGGRRYAACAELGLIEVPVVYKDTPEGAVSLREMELEENTQRADMSWQDKVRAIAEIHRQRQRLAAQTGDMWTMVLTGELLGLSLASIGNATQLDKLLRGGDTELAACTGIVDALNVMTQRRLDDANRRLALRIQADAKKLYPIKGTDPAVQPTVDGDETEVMDLLTGEVSTVDLSNTVLRGNALDLLSTTNVVFTHIITDPPYGIDMDMLQQEGSGMDVDRVRATHDVSNNLEMLRLFIHRAVPHFTGFLVLWTDAMNFRYLHDIGIEAGLAVQRWPITWHKTSHCMNQAVSYNTTKNTEIAIVMRQRNAIIPRPAQSSVISAPTLFSKDHLFAKPASVWYALYTMFTQPGDTVLDPFAGTGSAPLAALDSNLRPSCCEIEEHHYNALLVKMQQKYKSLLGPDIRFV